MLLDVMRSMMDVGVGEGYPLVEEEDLWVE